MQNVEHISPALPQQDETRRLLSLLLVMAERVAEEFVRQELEAAPADKAAFTQSYDHLMDVSRIVAPVACEDLADTKALPQSHLPD